MRFLRLANMNETGVLEKNTRNETTQILTKVGGKCSTLSSTKLIFQCSCVFTFYFDLFLKDNF